MRILAQMAVFRRIGAVLAGAVTLASVTPALAQDGDAHPLDSALEMMNLKTQAGPMPDFVTQDRRSRAAGTYIPVGAKPPARTLKPASAADVKSLTAELDAARDAQLSGKRPKPMSTSRPPSAKTAGATARPPKLRTGHQATNR